MATGLSNRWAKYCPSTVTLAIALVWCSVAAAQDVAISAEARAHFTAGVSHLQDPDGPRYADGYQEFKAAYAASPSWKILGNLGICAMALERDGEAIESLRGYLAKGGTQIDNAERAQFERDLQTLETSLAKLSLSFSKPGGVLVDERVPTTGPAIVNRYGPTSTTLELGVRAGSHRLSVELEGYQKAEWEIVAAPRQHHSHTFELVPLADVGGAGVAPPAQPPIAPRPPRDQPSASQADGGGTLIPAYVAFGVGAIGVGVGTVFALRSKSKYDEANELCDSYPCDLTPEQAAQRADLGEQGDSAKTLSIVGFVAAGVGLATGVTLLVFSANSGDGSSGARVAPWVGLRSAGLEGSF